jgi:putative ABC transport system permease protein
VREELASINRQLAQEYPRTHTGWLLGVELAREWQYGSMRAPLLMLLAATAFVLLIACVNIANLTSAQAIARSGELALRLALGATRADVLRMHVAELLIICVCGLIPGLLLASAAVPALLAINPTIARALGPVEIDWRVQLFSGLVAMLMAIGASAVPAMRAMRGRMSASISGSANRTTGSPSAVRLQRTLVSLEIALCVALMMAGAVVVQGLRNLSQRSPGYESAGVLTAQIRLPDAAYKAPELRAAVVARLLAQIRALPGVTAASTTQNAFVPGFSYQTQVHAKDRPTADRQPHTVQFRRVSTDYFKTMQDQGAARTTLRRRRCCERAAGGARQPAICGAPAAGRRPRSVRFLVRNAANAPPLTVVGVVDDVFDVSVTEAPEPTLYLPWAQNNNSTVPVAFVIRTAVDPASMAPAVRGVLKEIDRSLPLRRVQPMDAFVAESTAPERFRTMVLGIIAMLGLVLAAVGISGVTYRGVIDRNKEFRRAAGAGIAARRDREAGALGVGPRSRARRSRRARRRRGALRRASRIDGEHRPCRCPDDWRGDRIDDGCRDCRCVFAGASRAARGAGARVAKARAFSIAP